MEDWPLKDPTKAHPLQQREAGLLRALVTCSQNPTPGSQALSKIGLLQGTRRLGLG